ncbi:hypothetical protein CL617_02535 [archaeon]|nr:hypothetical protein [archaeon]|tara:strand:+ start:692 stop:1240 length:549 start_codon:yes stop_codon:yes gene_type:complete
MESRIVKHIIPRKYFWTKGAGESDLSHDPGSYHKALYDAEISGLNISLYSSTMPKEAQEISIDESKILHGEQKSLIQSRVNVRKDETGIAGIILGWLYDFGSQERLKGFVCEIKGDVERCVVYSSKQDAENFLRTSLKEMYQNHMEEGYMLEDMIVTQSITSKKEYGTAIVAICFDDHTHLE